MRKTKELSGVPAGVHNSDLPSNTSKIYHYHFLLLTSLTLSEIWLRSVQSKIDRNPPIDQVVSHRYLNTHAGFKPSLVLVWLVTDEVVRVQFLHFRTLRFWTYNNHSAIYLHSSTIRGLYIRPLDTASPRNWIHVNRTIKLNTASTDWHSHRQPMNRVSQ
jgi:hypothetical protein